jgi:hypothetical protein
MSDCSQIEDQTAIHLEVELEVEVVQMFGGFTKLRLFVASLQQLRHSSSSETSMEIMSMGIMASDCACSRRVSSTVAMPLRRSCARVRLSSIKFMIWIPRSESRQSRAIIQSRSESNTCR